jgi:UDP-N-acetylmuramoyl-tripeptide--D-alanyl-D-alanine ligase
MRLALEQDRSLIEADILGHPIAYTLGAPGRHLVMNSLAVLAACALAEADLARGAAALAALQPAVGRGARMSLTVRGGEALLIDESYNANPASMRAALALLGQAVPGPGGRRIAVLGDMLELGADGPRLHAELSDAVETGRIDLVYCSGPQMRALWDALPSGVRGGYAETAAGLQPDVVTAVRAGDVVMVKGSLGSKMGPIVKALQREFPRR